MPRKILMLLNSPYPDDFRVRKEASALIAAGFEVHLLCLRQYNQAGEEKFQEIQVHRIDAGKNVYHLAFWDVIMSLTFIHPRFKRAAKKLIQKENIHLLHAHDLPMAGTALALKRESDVQVVVDLHENYPEALALWFAWKRNWLVRLKNYLFMNATRWFRWEAQAVEQSDRIIAVVEEMKEHLLRKYTVAPDKITVVSNTEFSSFADQVIDPAVYASYPGKFIVTYTGGLGPARGLDIAIEGMKYLKAYPNILLVIIGSGSADFIQALNKLIATQDAGDQVVLLGQQPFSKVFSFMSLADVNIIPHKKDIQSENGVPHKLFQSMIAGKPTLVSSCGALKRIVNETGAGLVFEAGDPKDFADKLLEIYSNKVRSKEMGERGTNATLHGIYNWEQTAVTLVKLYQGLVR